MAGNVASCKAGPGVIISFIFAAIASAFSALCYAEFAGRVPRAGSAYVYSYITVGELVAFIIGWNMVLEYVIGAAAVTRGFSGYLRFIFEETMDPAIKMAEEQIDSSTSNSSTLTTYLKSNITSPSCRSVESNGIVTSFDWLSVLLIVFITLLILFGVKHSTKVTLIFTSLNLMVVGTILISGFSVADIGNWQLKPENIPKGFGSGGFLPYGWTGVMAGSATCFFGFIGFDTIASSAEEAKNPKRNVPLSILLSLFISFLAYMAMAIIQTLIWPYYDQNRDTILPYVFKQYNMPVAYWIVTVGAIAGLASSQLAGMYPLPRTLYSMSYDKLIYAYLSKVSRKFKLPIRSIIVGSILVALPAAFLKTEDLADMVSIGTLAAYSLVSLSVLILRYEYREQTVDDETILAGHLNFSDIFNALDQQEQQQQQQDQVNQNNFQLTEPNGRKKEALRMTQINGFSLSAEDNGKLENHERQANENDHAISKGRRKNLVPQLSVGFYSWFMNTNNDNTQSLESQNSTFGHKLNGGVGTISNDGQFIRSNKQERISSTWQNILELLIVWRSDPNRGRSPTKETSKQSKILISAIVILSVAFNLVSHLFITLKLPTISDKEQNDEFKSEISIGYSFDSMQTFLACTNCMLVVLLAATMLMLSRLPRNRDPNGDAFEVPFVPVVPTMSIIVNTILMLNLNLLTWVRFTVWMTVGLFIYFTYGIWKSEGHRLYSLDR